ncbi:MAG: DUF4870 domain-containing protein [Intrasporangiaceae bacterium]|nr:DUF4870 domain-containing protein [Intrasporangiaceae bacterium]
MTSMPPPPSPYGANAGQPGPLNPNDEKTWALGTHLLCLVASFIAPLVVWLVFKGRGPFLEHHAKEALNFQITVLIAAVVSSLLILLLVGFVLLPLVGLWALIMPIIAAVKASNGDWYRYPLTIRFIK